MMDSACILVQECRDMVSVSRRVLERLGLVVHGYRPIHETISRRVLEKKRLGLGMQRLVNSRLHPCKN
jgi:hypothetical protein